MVEILTTPHDARSWSRSRRKAGHSVGFVPTMGALHDGHATLVRRSSDENTSTVVSIFVNPTQFDRGSDFTTYPRTEHDDITRCENLGVDAVYMPTVDAVYPAGSSTTVDPGPIAAILEGAARPGHFAGVATVVVKLLTTCEPDVAYFGEKDLQQLSVVRRVVTDLDVPVSIVGVPTVREPDGLAMSSRNRRLTDDDRRAATCVARALFTVRDMVAAGEHDAHTLRGTLHSTLASEPRCRVDYAEIVDRSTFETVDSVEGAVSACIAVWFGDVRLIDNISLSGPR